MRRLSIEGVGQDIKDQKKIINGKQSLEFDNGGFKLA